MRMPTRNSLLISLVAASLAWAGGAAAQMVTLTADKATGRDPVWKSRPDAGKPTWGIDGTGRPLNGYVWWKPFPGPTAQYKCEVGAVIESDGQSRFRLYAGADAAGVPLKVFDGQYPAATASEKVECNLTRYEARYLPCGEFTVKMGDEVRLWGESVYPCGSAHGQYTRFWEVRLTQVASAMSVPPKIVSFALNKQTVVSGQMAALSWMTEFANKVTLNGDMVAASGTASIMPTGTMQYTLVAASTTAPGMDSKTLTVTVNAAELPVTVDSLTVTPATILVGESAMLAWKTSNATSVDINGRPVDGSGSMTVDDPRTTTYTITAKGFMGPATKMVTLTAKEPGVGGVATPGGPGAPGETMVEDKGGCQLGGSGRGPGSLALAALALVLAGARARRGRRAD